DAADRFETRLKPLPINQAPRPDESQYHPVSFSLGFDQNRSDLRYAGVTTRDRFGWVRSEPKRYVREQGAVATEDDTQGPAEGRRSMFAAERRQRILELMRTNGSASLRDL